MRAGNGIDAVQLNEAEPADQVKKISAFGTTGRRFSQSVAIHEDGARRSVVQLSKGHKLSAVSAYRHS